MKKISPFSALFCLVFACSLAACTLSRTTSQTTISGMGKIIVIGETYLIEPLVTINGEARYAPTALPDDFKKQGLIVQFSGNTQPISPNVRMMGTPLKLTKIEKIK